MFVASELESDDVIAQEREEELLIILN